MLAKHLRRFLHVRAFYRVYVRRVALFVVERITVKLVRSDISKPKIIRLRSSFA